MDAMDAMKNPEGDDKRISAVLRGRGLSCLRFLPLSSLSHSVWSVCSVGKIVSGLFGGRLELRDCGSR